MKKFSLYQEQRYPNQAITIIRCMNPGDACHKVLYEVSYDCCGMTGVISHRSLNRREQRGVTLCRKCAQIPDETLRKQIIERRLNAEEMRRAAQEARERVAESKDPPYGFVVPPWSVPINNRPRPEWGFFQHQV